MCEKKCFSYRGATEHLVGLKHLTGLDELPKFIYYCEEHHTYHVTRSPPDWNVKRIRGVKVKLMAELRNHKQKKYELDYEENLSLLATMN